MDANIFTVYFPLCTVPGYSINPSSLFLLIWSISGGTWEGRRYYVLRARDALRLCWDSEELWALTSSWNPSYWVLTSVCSNECATVCLGELCLLPSLRISLWLPDNLSIAIYRACFFPCQSQTSNWLIKQKNQV